MSLHIRTALLAIVFAVLVVPATASAADINVSPSDNLTTKLSSASAGDRLILSAGSYGHVDTTASFASDVIVQPAAGAAVTTQGWRFESGASHIVLRGLTIREPNFSDASAGSAVTVNGGASYVTVEDCKLTEGRHGLRIDSATNTTPTHVTLRDSEITGDGTNDGIQIDGVNIGGGQGITIDHNVIHDIHIGLSTGGVVNHDDGVQVFVGDDVTITRNTIYETTQQTAGPNQGIIVGRNGSGTSDASDVTIEDNLTYNWPGSGITVSGATNVSVIHNTSYDAGLGSDSSLSISEADGSNSLTVANNILEKYSLVGGAADPSVCTTNLVSTFSPSGASSGCSGTITSSPSFDSSVSPYYLASNSPAIDAANGSYPPASGLGDLDETTRPGTADIGAREWHPLTDTFVGTSGDLASHTGEGSAAWTLDTADPGTADLSVNTVVAHAEDTTYSYTASWTPSDNSYAVETELVYRGPGSGDFSGPVCRWSASGSKNGYLARIRDGNVELYKFVSGTSTLLTSTALPSSYYVGQPLRIRLDCSSTKTVYLDGSSVLTSNDNAVTQVGKAGVRGNTQTLPVDTVDAFDVS